MGINVINNTGTQELILPTGSTSISAGDLVVNNESGYAAVASPSLTIAQNNNNTTGPLAIVAGTIYNGSNAYGFDNMSSQGGECLAQLSSGDLVFCVSGNGSASSTSLTLNYRNLRGGVPYPPVTVSTGSVSGFVVRRITTVGVAVVWSDGSTLRFAIYSNTGATVKAATTVASIHSSGINSFNAHVLANGNLVIAYDKITTRNVAFSIYDTTGTIVGSEVTVESSATPSQFCVRPQSNGNFVVYYRSAGGSPGYKFARYNSSGALQGTLTTITSQSNSLGGALDNLCVELTNGNLVFIAPDAGANSQFAVYDASGASVRSPTNLFNNTTNQGSAFNYSSCIPGVVATATGFVLANRGNGAGTINFATYNNSGANLQGFSQATSAVTASMNTQSYYGMRLIDLGNAGLAALTNYTNSSCTSYYYTDLVCFNLTGTRVGSLVNLTTVANTGLYQSCALLTQDGSLFVSYGDLNSSGRAFTAIYAVQRKSVIGVAQQNIPANSSGRVATVGSFTLNSSYTGAQFDQRTATVPGTRGTVVGNSAVLFGMS